MSTWLAMQSSQSDIRQGVLLKLAKKAFSTNWGPTSYSVVASGGTFQGGSTASDVERVADDLGADGLAHATNAKGGGTVDVVVEELHPVGAGGGVEGADRGRRLEAMEPGHPSRGTGIPRTLKRADLPTRATQSDARRHRER